MSTRIAPPETFVNLRTSFDPRYRRSIRIGASWVSLLGVAASLVLDLG